jgi:hypothetical protein
VFAAGFGMLSPEARGLLSKTDKADLASFLDDIRIRETLSEADRATIRKTIEYQMLQKIGDDVSAAKYRLPAGAKAITPSTIAGEGFTMADMANPTIIGLGKKIKTIDVKLDKVRQGKSTLSVDATRQLIKDKQALIDQVDDILVGKQPTGIAATDIIPDIPTAPKTSAIVGENVTAPQVSKTVDTPTIKTLDTPSGKVKVATNPVEFNSTSYKQNKITGTDLVDRDKQTAIDMATGRIESTPAQRQELYKILSDKASEEGDWDTINQLSNPRVDIEASIAGQTLGQRGFEADPFSAVNSTKALKQARQAALKSRYGLDIDKAISNANKTVTKAVKKPTVKDWTSFVESLRCK